MAEQKLKLERSSLPKEWHYPEEITNQSATKWSPEVQSFVIPQEIILFGKMAAGWEIVKPFQVVIEQDENSRILVSEELFLMYGIGDTLDDALRDYETSLMEYYELVSEQAGDNDPPTQALFRHLQRYIRKVGE